VIPNFPNFNNFIGFQLKKLRRSSAKLSLFFALSASRNREIKQKQNPERKGCAQTVIKWWLWNYSCFIVKACLWLKRLWCKKKVLRFTF